MAFAEEEEEEEEEEAVRFVVVCIKVVITSLLNTVPSLEFISVFPVYFKLM